MNFKLEGKYYTNEKGLKSYEIYNEEEENIFKYADLISNKFGYKCFTKPGLAWLKSVLNTRGYI